MSRSVNLCALTLTLVLTGTCAIAQNEGQRIIKVCTLNSVQANEEFNRNVQIMQAQRQLLVSKHNALKAVDDAEARETIQVEIDELLDKINANNKKMYATYGFSLTRNYTIEPDESFVFMLVSDDEAAKYAEKTGGENPVGTEGQQKLIKVCTLGSAEANREFNRNVNLVKAQRQLAVGKHKQMETATEAQKEEIQAEIDDIMLKLNENNDKMFKTYGFSVTRNYTISIAKANVYMWVSDDEYDKYEAAKNE